MMYAEELWYDISKQIHIFNALEVFHDFILAHDDIVDQDGMRWGSPTIHTRLQTAYPEISIHDREHFWKSLAMIGGDVLHAMAQSYIFQAPISNASKIATLQTMNEAMLDVARGRYKQFLSDSMQITEVDLDYILDYNLRQVTGSYSFLFPLRFGHALVQGNGNMEIDPLIIELCKYIGILFQTGDDLIGIFGDPSKSGKSNHGDIIQGKKTIPLYFAYHTSSKLQKSQLDALIGKQDLTESEAQLVKNIIMQQGLQQTKDFMQEYAEKAFAIIEQLHYSDEYIVWWKEFVEFLMEREM